MILALKTLLIAWLAVFLQSSVAHSIRIWGLVPDLLALAITAKALRDGVGPGVAFGAAVGFLADCYRPATMGLGTLSGTVIGYLAGSFRERIYREQLPSQMALAGLLALVRQPFEFFGQAGGTLAGYPWFLLRHGLGCGLYTALAAAILLPWLNRWWRPGTARRTAQAGGGVG